MALNPSPQRQSVVTFPTPNVNDILFFESVDAEQVGTEIPEYGSKHPDSKKWPNHRLIHVEAADPKQQTRYYRYYYAADQLDQDNDNWSHTEADIGGTKFDAVARDYVIRRSEFNPELPAMGATMPNVPVDKFPSTARVNELNQNKTDTYVLAQRKQTPINDKVLNGLYVIEQRVYVKKVPLYRLDFDEFFSQTNYTKQTLMYATEQVTVNFVSYPISALAKDPNSPYWKLTTGGILRTVQQLSDNWYAVTKQQVVNTTATNSAGNVVGGLYGYNTTVNFSFPPVLDNIYFDPWEKRSGAITFSPRVEYSKGAYRGPCKATVSGSWSLNPPTLTTLTKTMQPESIAVSTPYFNLRVRETLHGPVTVRVDNGTEDETYVRTAGKYDFDATNHTDWPDFLIVSSTSKKFRGGYLKEDTIVHAPPST
ncbi:MAG: hypothetical protein CMO61_11365 [Verrucomicrobiales bacterium]|nr:hypothetical protein [Verrucomicrobiales bacterium]|tara:strand:+ start:4485 stop:5756 length:1272 start_codon:yes stop_codon:yes gene_type:complete